MIYYLYSYLIVFMLSIYIHAADSQCGRCVFMCVHDDDDDDDDDDLILI